MTLRTVAVLLFALVFATGCIGLYRYESHGTVDFANAQDVHAVMYWFSNDGRLWYGKRYQQTESDIEMNVCNRTSKLFQPLGEPESKLHLPSKSGDEQVIALGADGVIEPLEEPRHLRTGSDCGRITVANAEVLTEDLVPGAEPQVIIFCRNVQNPDRYPLAQLFEFTAVERTRMKEREAPILNCPE